MPDGPDPTALDRALSIRRRVRLESGRPDGRCGKVSEAIAAELGWAYRWGHLLLLGDGICWIHCWNEAPDGTVVDTTADQFEERWLGEVAVLPLGDPRHAHYRPSPPGHLFRTALIAGHRHLLARRAPPGGQFSSQEVDLANAPDTPEGWTALGARAAQTHSGWPLADWIAEEAGALLCQAETAGRALSSREMEFALDAVTLRRRAETHGEWRSPEWRQAHPS